MSKKTKKKKKKQTVNKPANKINEKSVIIAAASALVLALIIVGIVLIVRYFSDRCSYAYQRDIEGRDVVYVEMSVKDCGKVTILLDKTTAPVTVENFVSLVERGFYDGLTFHRIIDDFMIQGGAPNGEDTADEIKGEFWLNGHYNDIEHIKGVISMARTEDYDSASSQFFICNEDSPHLDGQYAAFGYVVSGLRVVDKITSDYVGYTYDGMIYDKTKQPVIEYIRVVDFEE